MILAVNVKPNSNNESIEKLDNGEYLIYVREPARENKANKRVIMLLAKELGISWKSIKLKNASSRKKYFFVEKS